MQAYRSIVAVTALIFLLLIFPLEAQGQTLTRVESSVAGYTGTTKQDFPANTRFDFLTGMQAQTQEAPMEALWYEGQFLNGLAHGEGVIGFTGTRTPSGEQLPIFYSGTFEEGRPIDGNLVISRTPMLVQTVSARGAEQITTSYNDLEVASFTPITAENKVLVRLMQYDPTHHGLPTRMFFGEISTQGAGGEIVGEWVELPWYYENQNGAFAGYGRNLEVHFNGETPVSCVFPERPDDDLELIEYLAGRRGWRVQWLYSFDEHVLSTSATCRTTDENGWSFTVLVDFTENNRPSRLLSCQNASGRAGTVNPDNSCTVTRRRPRHDWFTNIGQEFKRFVDRRIIGSIDRAGGAMERAMCRASGTEPGVNCSVGVQVGVTWPVGEGEAPNLPPEERTIRNQYIEASRRARSVPGALGDTELGTAAAMAADLNAVCVALCTAESQRRFSASLLAELERVAKDAPPDAGRTIASVNRETASVLGASVRIAIRVAPYVATAVPMYRFGAAVSETVRIQGAIDMVLNAERQPNVNYLVRRTNALATLNRLRYAQLHTATVAGAETLGMAIASNIRILAGLSPGKVTALVAAIAMGRTAAQIRNFVEKYKNVSSERELHDAIIREAIAPLGLEWPPPR